MKMNNLFMTALLASALVFFGCKTSSDNSDSDDGITAPTVSSATELAATGGTAPTTETAAKTLFTGATTALNALVSDSASSKSVASKKAGARTAKTETIPYTYTSSDGTLSYSGSATMVSNLNSVTPVANTTYKNYYTLSYSGTVNGTIKNATVKSGNETYTISGVVKNVISETVSIDLKTGSASDGSDASFSINLALGLGIGSALSVKRTSDGVGAKFVITYAANYAKDGITNSDLSYYATAISGYLKSQSATLTVYDDADTVIYKTTLTGDEAFSTSILEN